MDAVVLVGGMSSDAAVFSHFHIYLLTKDLWIKLKGPVLLDPRYNFGVDMRDNIDVLQR